MAVQLVILDYLAKVLIVLLLVSTIPHLYRLMKKDSLPNWNLVSISLGFFALSICFNIIYGFTTYWISKGLEHFMLMLSGILIFGAFYVSRKIKGGNYK